MLGSILAVTALCATSVFGASLTHLTTTPALYGQPFDVWLNLNGRPMSLRRCSRTWSGCGGSRELRGASATT